MKIYIARHYWKDGQNATWECHNKVDKEVFEYIKENYHKFVKNRIKEISLNNYDIYLCYEDAKDIFDRDITSITFFISKVKVTSSLCSKTYKNLEIKIKEKKNNFIVIGVIVLVIIGFFGSVLFKNDTSQSNTHKTVSSKVQDYSDFLDNWNSQVQNISEKRKYLLSRDSNTKVVKQLNNFVKPFYDTFDDSKLSKRAYADVEEYKKFIKINHLDKRVIFNEDMNRVAIKNGLKKVTNENSISGIVEKVLMMNDINIFLSIRDE
jgi:gas vesicle protein